MRFGWRESGGPGEDETEAQTSSPVASIAPEPAAPISSQARARSLPSAMESLVLLRTILLGVALVLTVLLAFVVLVIPPWIDLQRGGVGLESQFDRLESSVLQLEDHTKQTDDHLRTFLAKCQQAQISTIVRTERVTQAAKQICLTQTQSQLQTCRQVLHDAALVQNRQHQSVCAAQQQLAAMGVKLPIHAPLEEMQQLAKDFATSTDGSTHKLSAALVHLSLAHSAPKTANQVQIDLTWLLCAVGLLGAGSLYFLTTQRGRIGLARMLRSCSVSSAQLWRKLIAVLCRFVVIEDLRANGRNSDPRRLRKLFALWNTLKDLPAAVYGS